MAESEPIQSSDVFADDVFERQIAPAQKLLAVAKELEETFKVIAISTGKKVSFSDPKTVADAEKQIQAYKALTDLDKQSLAVKEQVRVANKKINDEVKNQIALQNAAKGSLAQLRVELKLLQQQYDNLSKSERENENVGGVLLKNIQALDTNVKKLEESTGRHQRSVGDYAKGLKNLNPLLVLFSRYTGIDTSAIHDFGAAIKGTSSLQKIYNLIIGDSIGLMKVFKLTLAATGIGAILLLIGNAISLYNQLKDAEEKVANASEFFNKALENEKYWFDQTNQELERKLKLDLAIAKSAGASEEEIYRIEQQAREKRWIALVAFNNKLSKFIDEHQNGISTPLQAEELRKNADEIKNIENEIEISRFERQEQRNKKAAENQKKALDEFTKNQKEGAEKALQYELEVIKVSRAETESLHTKGLISEEEYQQDIAKLKKDELDAQLLYGKISYGDYLLAIKDIEKGLTEFLKKEEKKRQEEKKKAFEETYKIAKNEAEKLRKIREEDEKENEKKRQERLKEAKDLEEKISSYSKDRIEAEKKLNADKISQLDKDIQTETDLQVRGLDNQLAYLKREKAKAIAEQKELDRAESRRQRAEKIVDAFWEIMGKNGGNVLDALKKIFAGKAAAATVSGSFFQGTEKVKDDLKGNKVHSGRDGYHIAVDGEERIVDGENNRAIEKSLGKISNDDLVKLAVRGRFNLSDKSKRVTVIEAANTLLAEKIDNLTNVVKNKRENTFKFNEEGKLTEAGFKENGFSRQTTLRRTIVLPRKESFKPGRKI